MSAHDWILFASATPALNRAPGSDPQYVLARSIAQGRCASRIDNRVLAAR